MQSFNVIAQSSKKNSTHGMATIETICKVQKEKEKKNQYRSLAFLHKISLKLMRFIKDVTVIGAFLRRQRSGTLSCLLSKVGLNNTYY
jgi:hypothetical protein